MISEVKNPVRTSLIWAVNPFEYLYRLWGYLSKPPENAIPHLIGTLEVIDGRITEVEIEVVFHDRERPLVFREGHRVYFLVPVNPLEGVEGAYLRLQEILGEVL
ncbi:hypothetical protein [Thermococcus thioreducens]|uniref:Uncharacterized protein n=1 Tax=Thermococcus thioreducens TaxID=277988 RepID=A0A0Q2RGH0_9EURY|nr:hypothetical protein [Thermococcus thioreducens]ASJ12411.1 hypothetical protein A3L14_05670 [Thermococcus thioreducens]KQH83142.1 hypothetical protein AMR53_02675 [Thermococcus thioreducens]SEV91299.1 hypothetical protein SAMN05216170_0821 [Thermococcus thioreducens]